MVTLARELDPLPSGAGPKGEDREPHGAVLVSFVVPVYRNRETLPELVQRLERISARLAGRTEAIFVIDGSPDDSGAMLRVLLSASGMRSQLLWHSRNFGSFAAIRTGLAAASGQCMVVMSADMQEPVELAMRFYEALASGACEVAVGVRRTRDDPRLSRLGSALFWWIYCHLVQREMPRGGVDVFACTPKVRDALVRLQESNSSLVGLVIWLGYPRLEIPYERTARERGRSGWTLAKKARYFLDSVYSFTDLPITVLLVAGVAGVALSVIGGLTVFLAWALAGTRVAGYTPVMLTLFAVGSLTLSGLGIVGSYVWRTYENSKRRPGAVAMLSESFHAEP
jgi:glycosyltransferase involved in cell wall biosynthesis